MVKHRSRELPGLQGADWGGGGVTQWVQSFSYARKPTSRDLLYLTGPEFNHSIFKIKRADFVLSIHPKNIK